MRILIDVDGVLCDLNGALCSELRTCGWDTSVEDWTYPTADLLLEHGVITQPQHAVMTRAMERRGFVLSAPIYPGAGAFVSALRDLGDLVAVTKPYADSETWPWERTTWLRPYTEKVIHTASKECVAGDVLIEDSVSNLHDWLEANPSGRGILIDRPWNRLEELHPRAARVSTFGQVVFLVHSIARGRGRA